MVFQNYALWPHMTVRGEHHVRPAAPQARRGGDRAPARRRAAQGQSHRARGPLSGPALRRPAAAGGAGARARAQPRHPAARRAAVQPRREDPRAGARGDPHAPAGARRSRRSTSPTTRRRRSRSPTAWPSCATAACSRWPRPKELYERPASTASWPTSSAPTTSSPACAAGRAGARPGRHGARAGPRAAGDGRGGGGALRPGRAPGERRPRRRRRERGATAGRPRVVPRQHAALRRRDRPGSCSRSTCATRGTTSCSPVGQAVRLGFPASVALTLPMSEPGGGRAPGSRRDLRRAARARRHAHLGVPGLFLVYPLLRIFYDAFSDEAGRLTLPNFVEFARRRLLPALALELAPARRRHGGDHLGAGLRHRPPARPLRLRGPRTSSATSR